MKRIAKSSSWRGVSIAAVLLTVLAGLLAEAARGANTLTSSNQQEEAAAPPPRLRLGAVRVSGAGPMSATVELVLAGGDAVRRVHVEIELAEGAWKFRKTEAPKGSGWSVSARRRREERASDGIKENRTVISLTIDGGDQGVPAGVVAVLNFSTENPAAKQPPITIRQAEFMQQSSGPPALEPPVKDAPINPSAGCFFFTH